MSSEQERGEPLGKLEIEAELARLERRFTEGAFDEGGGGAKTNDNHRSAVQMPGCQSIHHQV